MAEHLRKLVASFITRVTGSILPILTLAVLAVASPTLSANVIYKYVDEQGVTNFTEDLQQVPSAYLDRIQALDPVTLQPAKAAPATPGRRPSPSEPVANSAIVDYGDRSHQPATASWSNRLADLTIPLPSRYQLGVGLTTLVLIIGFRMVIRTSQNPAVKLLLKTSIMLMIGGTVYAIYLSSLNERISQATQQPAQRTMTGKELLGDIQGTAAQVRQVIDKTASPVKEIFDKTQTATVGEVNRTVSEANQTSRQRESALHSIDSTP